MKRLALFALLLPSIVLAEGLTWLEKDNPNELYFLAAVASDCSMTDERLQSLVKGVLVRSRIKPASSWNPNETTLEIILNCMKIDGGDPVFNLVIRFKKIIEQNDDGEYVFLITDRHYGAFGMGDSGAISQAVKEGVEIAITDYIEVNFVLGED